MYLIKDTYILIKDTIRVEDGEIFIDYAGTLMDILIPAIIILC